MSQEPVKIIVALEGGLINCIGSLGVPIDVIVIDYDVENVEDEEQLIPIDQGNGSSEMAVAYRYGEERIADHIRKSVEHLWQEDA